MSCVECCGRKTGSAQAKSAAEIQEAQAQIVEAHMLSPVISVRIALDEYDAFLALFKDDPDFPKTYDGWLERGLQEDAKYIAQGRLIHDAVIHPQEFADYCRRCGLNPSFATLHAFAVKKNYGDD